MTYLIWSHPRRGRILDSIPPERVSSSRGRERSVCSATYEAKFSDSDLFGTAEPRTKEVSPREAVIGDIVS